MQAAFKLVIVFACTYSFSVYNRLFGFTSFSICSLCVFAIRSRSYWALWLHRKWISVLLLLQCRLFSRSVLQHSVPVLVRGQGRYHPRVFVVFVAKPQPEMLPTICMHVMHLWQHYQARPVWVHWHLRVKKITTMCFCWWWLCLYTTFSRFQMPAMCRC